MQETEANETVVTAPVIRPDLELAGYLPDWMQSTWDLFTVYPGLLTILLMAVSCN